MTTTMQKRSTIAAMCAGLGLTVGVTLIPHLARGRLSDHIQAGYPDYPPARIDSAVSIYVVYLSVVGALGILCWLGAIWAVKAGKRWAPAAAAATFAVGTGVALFNLLVKDTSGDTGLPPMLGWAGLLPCLAGLVALLLLFIRINRKEVST